MTINSKDIILGAVFIAYGTFFLYSAYTTMPLGEAANIGPGYWPSLLAIVMIVIGLLILGRGLVMLADQSLPLLHDVPWRAVALLPLSVFAFALLLDDAGLVVAIMTSAFIASWADRGMKLVTALLTAVALAVAGTLIFGYGIGLPVPIFPGGR